MKTKLALSGIVLAFLISVFSVPVMAIPLIETFYGSVSVNGSYVNGSSVVPYNADTNATAVYQNPKDPQNPPPYGNYALDVHADGNISRVYFRINGLLTNEGIVPFVQGNYSNLTLTATDFDGDGYSVLEECDDSNPAVHPNATEVCNGIDDDCDDVIDEGFDVGVACSVGVGACARSGVKVCSGLSTTVCNAVPGTPVSEICGNGIDDDCDGTIDNGCGGGGGGGGGGGPVGYCGDGLLKKWAGEECEKDSDCNVTYVCHACKCVPCAEDWLCSGWGECSPQGTQTRTCTDANACGTAKNKPPESQVCAYTPPAAVVACGNGNCEAGETCDSCPADCGSCAEEPSAPAGPTGPSITGAITGAESGVASALPVVVTVAAIAILAYVFVLRPRMVGK
jgi:hypothetical protein